MRPSLQGAESEHTEWVTVCVMLRVWNLFRTEKEVEGFHFSTALTWLIFRAVCWTQRHLIEHLGVPHSHSSPVFIISVLECAKRVFVCSRRLQNGIFFSQVIFWRLLLPVISRYSFPSSVGLLATGKDCLGKRILSISFNSLCYDMFDSSWRTLSGLENELINFRY